MTAKEIFGMALICVAAVTNEALSLREEHIGKW
jgi:hypothetical protein